MDLDLSDEQPPAKQPRHLHDTDVGVSPCDTSQDSESLPVVTEPPDWEAAESLGRKRRRESFDDSVALDALAELNIGRPEGGGVPRKRRRIALQPTTADGADGGDVSTGSGSGGGSGTNECRDMILYRGADGAAADMPAVRLFFSDDATRYLRVPRAPPSLFTADGRYIPERHPRLLTLVDDDEWGSEASSPRIVELPDEYPTDDEAAVARVVEVDDDAGPAAMEQ